LGEELFFDYGEGGFEKAGRVSSEHDLEGAGFDELLSYLQDLIPMAIAVVGIIMSYKQPEKRNHALTTTVLGRFPEPVTRRQAGSAEET
jgi:hypothetical protein